MIETSQPVRRTDTQAVSLEMETFHLFDLARCSRGSIQAAACAIGLAQRTSNDFLASSRVRTLQLRRAALPRRANLNLASPVPTPQSRCARSSCWQATLCYALLLRTRFPTIKVAAATMRTCGCGDRSLCDSSHRCVRIVRPVDFFTTATPYSLSLKASRHSSSFSYALGR